MKRALPVVTAYTNYFLRKAKRDLKVKEADYKDVSIDYTSRGFVHIWFHKRRGGISSNIVYSVDGKKV